MSDTNDNSVLNLASSLRDVNEPAWLDRMTAADLLAAKAAEIAELIDQLRTRAKGKA